MCVPVHQRCHPGEGPLTWRGSSHVKARCHPEPRRRQGNSHKSKKITHSILRGRTRSRHERSFARDNTAKNPTINALFLATMKRTALVTLCFLTPVLAGLAAENLGVLGTRPRWSVLEHYQETITRDEFAHLIYDVYCTHGFAPDLIELNTDTARILTNRESQKFFTLRFAEDGARRNPVRLLGLPAKPSPAAKGDKPLSGLRIAIDPGHL